MINSVGVKTCAGCKESKPLTDFHKSGTGHYRTLCKPCRTVNDRAWRVANPDKAYALDAKWRSENKQKVRDSSAKWRAANQAKVKEARRRYNREVRDKQLVAKREGDRKYYAANPEKFREKGRRWRCAHPEHGRRGGSKRRARKADAGVFKITPKELQRLLNDSCYICGAPSEHIDHVMPLSKGGRHSIGNLAPACQRCNLRKNALLLIEFKMRLRREAA